tara:strand:- start:296 stop:418 length:123 start_codon:yes stop_codon:yes gene_type:complete
LTLSAEERQLAKSTVERAALQNSLITYNGTYKLEQNRWIT